MGRRNMYISHVHDKAEDNGYHPGCMSGFVHVLDYHHWNYNVKKILHHKKYEGRRHTKGIVNEETRLISHYIGEQQKVLDDSGSRFLVNKKNKHTHLAKKRSLRARIRALMANESKQQNGTKQKSSSSSRSLLRTYSIHHREPSNLGLSDIWKEKTPTIFFLPSSLDDGNKPLKVPKDPVRTNACSMNNDSEHQFQKKGDILDILNIDEDLFLRVVGSTENSTGKFSNTLPYFSRKEILTRSGSFPTADSSRRWNFKPSKLEHKKNEIWFSAGDERFSGYSQVPAMASLKFKKHFRAKSWSSAYHNDYSTIDRKLSLFSQISKTELEKEGQSGMIISLQESKQTEEPDAKEGRSKESISMSSLDEFSRRNVPSSSEKDTAGKSGQPADDIDDEITLSNCHEQNGYLFGKVALHHKRSSSLSELPDRYTKLYEYSSRQEVKLHPSKSLKLRNEYDLPLGGQLSFRRIRSLSILDFWYPIPNGVPTDAHSDDWPPETVMGNSSAVEGDAQIEEIRGPIPVIADDKATLDASEETENEMVQADTTETEGNVASLDLTDKVNAEMDDFIKKVDDSRVDKITTDREENIHYPGISAERLSYLFLHSDSGASVDGEASPTYQSEGVKNICNHVNENENDSYINSEQTFSSSTLSGSIVKLENFEHVEQDGRNLGRSEFNERGNTDLNYVREVLERSGICGDAMSAATSNSLDPPMSPSVLEEMETSWHNELEFSEEDVHSCFHHQLLFDLINEELVRMRDRSFTCYPKALSYCCRIRPSPPQVGNHIIDEVSGSISTLLNKKPNGYQTLDNIASEDLAKDDGWMNLQLESECVALQLEDMVFDELLEEILCS